MEKKIILGIFLFLLVFPLSSAYVLEMQDTFNEEGFLIAKLSGSFIDPPTKENIFLYRGHVRVGFNAEVARINDDYYIFASLSGKTPSNYSLVIEKVSYRRVRDIISEDITKNFTIVEGSVDFLPEKGFVHTKNNFFIELENLVNKNLGITMEISTVSGKTGGITSYSEGEKHTIELKPGKNNIEFKINIEEPTIKIIKFSSEDTSYEIPVSLYADDMVEAVHSFSLEISPPELELTMNLTEQRTRLIAIYNTGTGILKNVTLRLDTSLEPYVSISPKSFGQIFLDDNAVINVTILASATDGKIVSGRLLVESEQGAAYYMNITITSKEGHVPTGEELAPQFSFREKCEDIGGKKCNENTEICDGESGYARDGFCCLGKCVPKPKGKSSGKFFGWTIIIAIILIAVWFFFKKYKKAEKPIDLLKIAKGKK